MPTPIPPGLRIGIAEPEDAVAAFARRKLLQPSFVWQDVFQQEHARSFAAAGVTRLDVLQLLRDEVDLSLREGRSLADFRARVRPALVAKGFWGDITVTDPTDPSNTREIVFNDARLKTIFDVNMRQSQAAGRWARIERNRERFPFVLYRTMQDERVRASHRAWNGVALPVGHPWWATHYPPNGWRCRCRAFAVNARELARRRAEGQTIQTEPPDDGEPVPFVNDRTGEELRVPRGIDPGFAYNPGQQPMRHAGELQRRALDAATPEIAVALVRDQLRSAEFLRFVTAPLANELQPVAMLARQAAAAIGASSRTVMLEAATVATQFTRHPEIAAADYQWVQLAVDAGQRIQDGPRRAVYVLERDGWVAVVTATAVDSGVVLTSLRRLSAADAQQDAELLRLRKEPPA